MELKMRLPYLSRSQSVCMLKDLCLFNGKRFNL